MVRLLGFNQRKVQPKLIGFDDESCIRGISVDAEVRRIQKPPWNPERGANLARTRPAIPWEDPQSDT